MDLPDPGIEPMSLMSPALDGGFFTTGATWEAQAAFTKHIRWGKTKSNPAWRQNPPAFPQSPTARPAQWPLTLHSLLHPDLLPWNVVGFNHLKGEPCKGDAHLPISAPSPSQPTSPQFKETFMDCCSRGHRCSRSGFPDKRTPALLPGPPRLLT